MATRSGNLVIALLAFTVVGCGSTSSGPDAATDGKADQARGDTGGGGGSGGSGGAGDGAAGAGGQGDGGACVAQGQSCSGGQACCSGLDCCTGVPVPPGQETCRAVCPISDRNMKRDFAPVNPDAVLATLARLPISTWSYKTEGSRARHIGPMAQDFMAAFGVGSSDSTILQVDADGVALVAIQALRGEVQRLEERNAALGAELAALRAELRRGRAAAAPGAHPGRPARRPGP